MRQVIIVMLLVLALLLPVPAAAQTAARDEGSPFGELFALARSFVCWRTSAPCEQPSHPAAQAKDSDVRSEKPGTPAMGPHAEPNGKTDSLEMGPHAEPNG